MFWHAECLGKLKRLGISHAYLKWIDVWLSGRRGFIEFDNCRSRWFRIEKGGPQTGTTSHMFADEIAVILAGQLGLRYSEQCLDLAKRVNKFLDYLEYYSVLADQPLDYLKTEAMFSSRATGHPKFDLVFPNQNSIVKWQKNYKYLGYIISRKLGWSNLIWHTEMKIRRCISLINSFKLFGS